MEDSLKTVFELQREGEGRVSTSEVAERLDVTALTATSMMETLAEGETVSLPESVADAIWVASPEERSQYGEGVI